MLLLMLNYGLHFFLSSCIFVAICICVLLKTSLSQTACCRTACLADSNRAVQINYRCRLQLLFCVLVNFKLILNMLFDSLVFDMGWESLGVWSLVQIIWNGFLVLDFSLIIGVELWDCIMVVDLGGQPIFRDFFRRTFLCRLCWFLALKIRKIISTFLLHLPLYHFCFLRRCRLLFRIINCSINVVLAWFLVRLVKAEQFSLLGAHFRTNRCNRLTAASMRVVTYHIRSCGRGIVLVGSIENKDFIFRWLLLLLVDSIPLNLMEFDLLFMLITTCS